ncbi:hypothetical protein BGX21_005979 [Mortierella sp. AD011]|nr:hypothetical protein BGX20_003530 [Mortierella sp. AD010]KAF9369392.1 hypothetical protein BGX21_005979 [Mortierella sp. AD011]
MTLSPQLIAATIQDDPSLIKDVQDLVASHPDAAAVITRLLTYFQTKQASTDVKHPKPDQGIAQYFTKGNGSVGTPSTPSLVASPTPSTITMADIGPAIYSTSPLSFLHPVRKKLVLSLHQQDIALVSPTNTSEIVCSAPYGSLYRIIAVPFLERTTKQTALILFFRHAGINTKSSKDAVWAVPLADDGKDFSLEFHSQHKQLAGLSEDLRSSSTILPPVPFVSPSTVATSNKRPDHILISVLSYFLRRFSPTQYSSSVDIIPNPSPPHPNFSAHLKSNQGTIYLLPTGILFAFRKPILFLRSAAIEAVGVHSVMSRTFDFEVVMDSTNGVSTAEDLEGVPTETKGDGRRAVGFGMVDTKEFGRMEEWIKKAGIRDRSLSEDLKAKDKAPSSTPTPGSKKRERTADGEGLSDSGSQVSSSHQDGITASKKKRQEVVEDDDDDDEEDQDFAPESEDEIMEEYDSNAEGSDSDEGEQVEKPSIKPVKKAKKSNDDEEDLEEESLGEDTDEDDEDEEEDDDDDEEGEEEGDEEAEEEAEEEEEEDEVKDISARRRDDDEEEIDELIDDD